MDSKLIERRNKNLINEFEKWLKFLMLSEETIERHKLNVDIFINKFLNEDNNLPVEKGCSMISTYFEDWFLKNVPWMTGKLAKESIVSIKKFYKFLGVNKIEVTGYEDFLTTIKNNKSIWIKKADEYDEDLETSSNFSDGIEKYIDDNRTYLSENNLKDYKDDLRDMVETLKRFEELKPWEWLFSSNYIAIKFADEEDIVFCSVLGRGIFFKGIILYNGIEELRANFRLTNEEYDTPEEPKHILNQIMITYEDRNDLRKYEYELIKASGVEIRGKKKWPFFRICKSGFYPTTIMFLEQVHFITKTLKAAIDFAIYLKTNPNKVLFMENGEVCIREFQDSNNYIDVIRSYDELFSTLTSNEIPLLYNELELKRISKNSRKTSAVWEVDVFYSLLPAYESVGIFYPAMILIFDINSQRVIGPELTHPYKINEDFQKYIVELIKQSQILPRKVLIRNVKENRTLISVFEKLGVEIEIVNKLTYLSVIKSDLYRKE